MKYKKLLFFIVLALASCHPYRPSTDIISGLVVNIPLHGTATEGVSGTQGVIYNATATSDRHGAAGYAMLFTAADSSTIDFGDLPLASFDSTNQFTISCWVRVTDTTGNMAVLGKRGVTGPFEYCMDNHFNHNGFTLDNWTANGATSIYGIDPLKAYVAITPGQWQHLAYVADGNSLQVYVNGVAVLI